MIREYNVTMTTIDGQRLGISKLISCEGHWEAAWTFIKQDPDPGAIRGLYVTDNITIMTYSLEQLKPTIDMYKK